MRDMVAAAAVQLAERGAPDPLIRGGIRRVVAARLASEARRPPADVDAMIDRWHRGPVAVVPERANEQHYEVPAAFFELILGPRLKYSSCLWDDGAHSLADAEEAMLALTALRAGVEDGMRILDLGCGWGSLTLWLAERYPQSSVVAVSNSRSQGRFIADRAAERGLTNVEHRVADVNHLDLEGSFDVALSIEMLEHVRNHPALLSRLASAMAPGATLFVHVFSHRTAMWEFEDAGAGDWMARTFFSGGVMPSHEDFGRMVGTHEVLDSWWVNGVNYRRTLDAWLVRLDDNRDAVAEVLSPVYGGDTQRWVQRWRMFLMASSEFFGWEDGSVLGVSHHRLRLR